MVALLRGIVCLCFGFKDCSSMVLGALMICVLRVYGCLVALLAWVCGFDLLV